MTGSPDNQHPEALAIAPLDDVAGKITTLMRKIRPQVVITFDPFGGYLHPDHVAIHRATVEAFHAAGDPHRYPDSLVPYQPQKLYFTVFPHRWVRVAVFLLPLFGQDPRRFGRNADIDLVKLSSRSFPIHTRVSIRPVIKEKSLAAACHQSQGGPPNSFVFRLINRLAPSNETFMRAHPPTTKRTREHDLFEGVSPDSK
jgi:LmbE family N-acetylglucosaminyl deacetylase